jgi:hypothetical protein
MTLVGEIWLGLQVVAALLYVLITLPAFWTKKDPLLAGRGMQAACVVAIFTPAIALFQPAAWSYLGVAMLISVLFLLYEGYLLDALRPEQRNGIFLLVPLMCWAYGIPVALLAYVPYRIFVFIFQS